MSSISLWRSLMFCFEGMESISNSGRIADMLVGLFTESTMHSSKSLKVSWSRVLCYSLSASSKLTSVKSIPTDRGINLCMKALVKSRLKPSNSAVPVLPNSEASTESMSKETQNGLLFILWRF